MARKCSVISYEETIKANQKYTYTVGEIYGCKRIISLSRDSKSKRQIAHVECINCGKEQTMRASDLMRGRTTSCTCKMRLDNQSASDDRSEHTNHQQGIADSDTRLYAIWGNMKYRCNTATAQGYERYGGRGIRVCDEWNNFLPFKEWALSAGYEDSLTIDRIDSNLGYFPGNCQWITKSENTARANKGMQHRKSDLGEYYAVSPDGDSYRFWNAAKFGREHGLNGGMIRKCAITRKPYKGWLFGH